MAADEAALLRGDDGEGGVVGITNTCEAESMCAAWLYMPLMPRDCPEPVTAHTLSFVTLKLNPAFSNGFHQHAVGAVQSRADATATLTRTRSLRRLC